MTQLPIPSFQPLGRAIAGGGAAIGGAMSAMAQAEIQRQSVEFETEAIRSLSQAEEDASLLAPTEAEQGFLQHQSITDLRDRLNEMDPAVRERAGAALDRRMALAEVRVRKAAIARSAQASALAVDDQIDLMAVQHDRGMMTMEEALDQINDTVDGFTGTAFDEVQAAKIKDTAAARFIDAEFQKINKSGSPATRRRNADRLLNSELAVSVLTPTRRAQLEASVNQSIQSDIIDATQSVERRAEDFSKTNDVDGLAGLQHELSRMPKHPRVRDAKVDVDQRIKKARQAGNKANEVLGKLLDPEVLTVDANDDDLDAAIRAAGGDTAPTLDLILGKVGRIPPSIRAQLNDDAKAETLNLPRYLEHMAVIDSHSRGSAELQAKSSGGLGEVAYYMLRNETDPDVREQRATVLSLPNAGRFLTAASTILAQAGKDSEQDDVGADPLLVTNAYSESLDRPTRMGAIEADALNNAFKYRYIEQRAAFNVGVEADAREQAVARAVGDFSKENSTFIWRPGGFRRLRSQVVPNKFIDLQGGFTKERALEAIKTRIASVMGSLSDEAVFTPAAGVVDGNTKSHMPVFDQGLLGFVTWDSEIGAATWVERNMSPQEFQRIAEMYQDNINPLAGQPHPGAQRRPGQTEPTPQQANEIFDTALSRYVDKHDGALPPNNTDPEFLRVLAEVAIEAGFE